MMTQFTAKFGTGLQQKAGITEYMCVVEQKRLGVTADSMVIVLEKFLPSVFDPRLADLSLTWTQCGLGGRSKSSMRTTGGGNVHSCWDKYGSAGE